jgi:hypothetical protein
MRLTLLAGRKNASNMAVDGRRRRDDLICGRLGDRRSNEPLLLHDDRRADLDPVIEIDHVLIGQANAAR